MIAESPSFGDRTVAHLLGLNKNTVQRIFQLKGWRGVRGRSASGLASRRCHSWPQPRTNVGPQTCVESGRDVTAGRRWRWIDCHTRELLGWHLLSRSGKACTASSALEHALIARFGTLGRAPEPFLLRSDNGLVFCSRSNMALVRSYGFRQEFITQHCPQQSGMVERVIRTLKEQCVYRQRFETIQHASRVTGDWIRFYNHRRPHQALNMKTSAEAFALAA